jgi:hypothetical protein
MSPDTTCWVLGGHIWVFWGLWYAFVIFAIVSVIAIFIALASRQRQNKVIFTCCDHFDSHFAFLAAFFSPLLYILYAQLASSRAYVQVRRFTTCKNVSA